MTTTSVLDLDAGRAERAKARAARNEARGDTLPIRLGGKVVATLPAEFAIDVLTPLTELDVDLAFVIKAVTQAAGAVERDEQVAGMNLLVNVLAANPALPSGILNAVQDIGKRLLGEDGYAALVAWRPSREDIAALAKGILSWYGVSLGEASPSPTSSAASGGETSKPISSASTEVSTRAASGKSRAKKGSSAPAAS